MSRAGRGAPDGAPDRVLVIGYGNTLRSDDGVGPRAAELLRADPRLSGIDVLARHQLTPELALDLASAAFVIFIDADVAGAPGEIMLRHLDPVVPASRAGSAETRASSHHVGVEELLALAGELGGHRPRAAIVSVGVATMGLGERISASVEAALPNVVDIVARLVAKDGAG